MNQIEEQKKACTDQVKQEISQLNQDLTSFNESQTSEQYQNKEEKERYVIRNADNKKDSLIDLCYFIGRFIISFNQFLIVTVVGIGLGFIALVAMIMKKNYSDLQEVLIAIFCLLCIVYSFINYFLLDMENIYVKSLYLDGILFITSTFLVFSYVKAFNPIQLSMNDTLNCGPNILLLKNTELKYIQDFKNSSFQSNRNNAKLDTFYFSLSNQKKAKMNVFLNLFRSPSYYSIRSQFFILVIIILLKLSGIFCYIYTKSVELQVWGIFDMTIIIFVYTYASYNLIKTFGSYDLRRKESQMKEFNELITFYHDQNLESNYSKKLDVTDLQSLEVFDHSRKKMLEGDKEYLEKLDYAYIGLVFYYIFVIIICASYYFELYWLIQAGSSLLEPIQVIMSTGNFVFLSAFLMFRFKHGTDFNDSFHELEITISHLLDTIEDLTAMYDYFFLSDYSKMNKFTCYGLLVRKLQKLSRFYIKKQMTYQGRLYAKNEKNLLIKSILMNMKNGLEKTKQSVQRDYKIHKYQFMGFVEVDVQNFLFTLLLGLLTALPSIIPKFIQFYQK